MKGQPKVLVVLLGLLIAAAAVLLGGETDDRAAPSAESYSPSGLRAFVELLKANGYHPVVDRNRKPAIGPNDIVVSFDVVRRDALTSKTADDEESEAFATNDWISDRVEEGAFWVTSSFQSDFSKSSRRALDGTPVDARSTGSAARLKVILDPDADDSSADDWDSPDLTPIWTTDVFPIASTWTYGDGRVIECRDGLPFSNRFVEKADDARLVMSLIRAANRPGAKVVFAEATWSQADDRGLFATIGGWASAAYYQAMFWFVVLLLCMGIRFGYPDEVRATQRGSRELLDAVAFFSRRAKHANLALAAAHGKFDRDIRNVLRIPLDASIQERDRTLTTELITALRQMDIGSRQEKLSNDQAMGLIDEAKRAFSAWVASRV